MFGRSKQSSESVVVSKGGPKGSPKGNIVQAGTRIHADMEIEGSLIFLGTLVGDLRVSGDLVVGRDATIEGNVDAQVARVEGKVKGDLKTKESVDLLPGSHLHGDVYTRCLRIEEGAILRGTSYMGDSWVDDDLQ